MKRAKWLFWSIAIFVITAGPAAADLFGMSQTGFHDIVSSVSGHDPF